MRNRFLPSIPCVFVGLAACLAVVGATSCEKKLSPERGGIAADKRTRILEATQYPGTLIGMQYESFFTPHNAGGYETAEAIPILGKYSSYDVNVIRKHEEWFENMGINWLLLDWSNMLWAKPAWEEHTGGTRELEETTDLLFKTYSQMEKEGKHPPKLVIMIGLQNGPPVPNAMERLNGIIAWTKKNFLDKPEYKNLWLYYHGKPLLTILYFPAHPCKQINEDMERTPLATPDWTVRWMASQLQNSHADQCGMWSWMDGTIRQVVTHNEGIPEETVVTPACFPFPQSGWLDPRATGRDHGAPYIASWKVAFESRPKFIQIHQWNEFAGQKEGEGFRGEYWGEAQTFVAGYEVGGTPRSIHGKHSVSHVYGDEYNLELSDDIEPTAMDKCAYRGCGGWGYYYVNLTKALISLYRNETPDITVMALSGPFQPAVVKRNRLPLSWETLGKPPSSYTLQLDGKTVAENIHGEKYIMDLSHAKPGKHRVTLVANGAHTYFNLSPEKLTEKSTTPLPVTSTIEFTYSLSR